ncbi:hypothetical protein N7463_009907 [Penicillium fimorum]|uniref:DUF3533 domain-containing protein n=1 Tax=Penicillium fimorum TaxID=1882269 RepID=A0A9W9XJR0_9EURO|nr:hypothetical protein N7463_009907 [Penicillium fimorum]
MGVWKEIRPRFLLAVITMFLLLQVLFLVNMCYLYATQFRSTTRYHNFNVLYVDYDGEDIREAVCRGEYWGGVYTSRGGSAGLASALANGYHPPTSLTYIWDGARYPVFSQAAVYSNILKLIETTRSTYHTNNGSSVAASADLSNPTILNAFLDPIRVEEINIKGTGQGTRVFYNTVSMVMPIIQQFFFILALNGISTHFDAFTKLSWKANGLIRVRGLGPAKKSVCTDLGYFVASDAHKLPVFDITTAFVPIQFMPFIVLTWVILNVASTISPFELNLGFFH